MVQAIYLSRGIFIKSICSQLKKEDLVVKIVAPCMHMNYLEFCLFELRVQTVSFLIKKYI